MFDKQKLILPIAIVIAVIIAGLVFYKVESDKQEALLEQQRVEQEREDQIKQEQKEAKEENQRKLLACLRAAEENYSNNWDSNCSDFGVNHRGPDCNLPAYIADDLAEEQRHLREICLKLTPVE